MISVLLNLLVCFMAKGVVCTGICSVCSAGPRRAVNVD